MDNKYRVCSKCIMDTTDPEITFDENGICNHCRQYEVLVKQPFFQDKAQRRKELDLLVASIKKEGRNKKYDCIIGLSGGVDSSYAAYYTVKRLGLRPLAVHLDNGWDTELAVNNVENIVKKLGIDLRTYVVDFEEFKDLQLAFLRSSVLDLEMLSDNAILVAIFKHAKSEGIRYFLCGMNTATEAILPRSWNYGDKVNGLHIRSIYKKFGCGKALKTYPIMGFWEYVRFKDGGDLKYVCVLDYIDYRVADAKKILTDELGWKDYGRKHCESEITRFYQSYILPKKFNIDKRKAHLSSLICSGQITRNEALKSIEEDKYDYNQLGEDKEFFLKKMGLSEKEFEDYIQSPGRPHSDYPSYLSWYINLKRIQRGLRSPFKTIKKLLLRKKANGYAAYIS